MEIFLDLYPPFEFHQGIHLLKAPRKARSVAVAVALGCFGGRKQQLWWEPNPGEHTVDGSEIRRSPVDMVKFSRILYLQPLGEYRKYIWHWMT